MTLGERDLREVRGQPEPKAPGTERTVNTESRVLALPLADRTGAHRDGDDGKYARL